MRALAGVAVLGLVVLSGCADSSAKPRANNERVEGFAIHVENAIAPAITDPARARVDVIWSTSGARRLDSSGQLIRQEPPAHGIEEQVDLVRSGASWRVAEITRIRV